MREWLHRQISSDQTFVDKVLGYLIVGFVFFLFIGISWFILFLIVKYFLKLCKWIYNTVGGSNSDIEGRFFDFDYFLDNFYDKYNIFKLMSNINDRLSEQGKLKFTLTLGVFWGVVALLVAFWFVYSVCGNPYHEYQLLKNGTTTLGFIIDVQENIEPRDAGGHTYYYYYTFKFKLPNGSTIEAYQELSGGSEQETPDVSEPYPTEIVYLNSNPEINKIKATLSDSVWEIIWRKIGLGLFLLALSSSFGFVLIRNAIKEYSSESKKHDSS
jgi:hypothetical protein